MADIFALELPTPGCGLSRCADTPRVPRPAEDTSWLLPKTDMAFGLGLVPVGAFCTLLLESGAIWVGKCLRSTPLVFELRLLGSNAVLRLRTSRRFAVAAVRPHSWAQEQFIARRQRAGEPAAQVTPSTARKHTKGTSP